MFARRIQPLKRHAHPLINYSGVEDLTRESREELKGSFVLHHSCQDRFLVEPVLYKL